MARRKTWVINWHGKQISNNVWYEARHWALRKEQKDEWREFFTALIKAVRVGKMTQYKLLLEFNSRLDTSNTIAMVKLFEDTLKSMGLIVDDSKKYCRGIAVEPDDDMPTKSYRLTLTRLT